jgi:hypothetical protein
MTRPVPDRLISASVSFLIGAGDDADDPPDMTLSAVIGTATAAAPADNRNISRRDQYDMMTHFRSRHSVGGFARGVKMADAARLNTYFAQRG